MIAVIAVGFIPLEIAESSYFCKTEIVLVLIL